MAPYTIEIGNHVATVQQHCSVREHQFSDFDMWEEWLVRRNPEPGGNVGIDLLKCETDLQIQETGGLKGGR